jgi:hypothetical protein
MALLWVKVDNASTRSGQQAQDFGSSLHPWLADYSHPSFTGLGAGRLEKESSFESQPGLDTLMSSTNRRKREPSIGDEHPQNWEFPCPIFYDEMRRGVMHTCSGGGDTMSELQQHLTRQKHLSFIEQCNTCNEYIIDEEVFYNQHGPKCQKSTPRDKVKAVHDSYRMLCDKLQEFCHQANEHNEGNKPEVSSNQRRPDAHRGHQPLMDTDYPTLENTVEDLKLYTVALMELLPSIDETASMLSLYPRQPSSTSTAKATGCIRPVSIQAHLEDTYLPGDRLRQVQDSRSRKRVTRRQAPRPGGFPCDHDGCTKSFDRQCDVK